MKKHKDLLVFISDRLKEKETMDGKEFYDIVNGARHCAEIEAGVAGQSETEPTQST